MIHIVPLQAVKDNYIWTLRTPTHAAHAAVADPGEPQPVLDIPGHTRAQIGYYGLDSLFCGDTLIACGCGRGRVHAAIREWKNRF